MRWPRHMFQIPMRGNEKRIYRASWSLDGFQIPMRGNEPVNATCSIWLIAVSNPHEG